jgi:hypothetical protein
MHGRFVERKGRGVGLSAQLAPGFLTFSDWLGIGPGHAAGRFQHLLDVDSSGLFFLGLRFQGIEHEAREQPIPDLSAGRGLVEENIPIAIGLILMMHPPAGEDEVRGTGRRTPQLKDRGLVPCVELGGRSHPDVAAMALLFRRRYFVDMPEPAAERVAIAEV